METQPRPLFQIVKFLPWIETLALLLLMASGIMMLLGSPYQQFLMIAMSTLAMVFFMYAYVPPQVDVTSERQPGFRELLAYSIAPKVLWISMSVTTIGLLFYALGFPKMNWQQMLLIGTSSMGLSILIQMGMFVAGLPPTKAFWRSLLRASPLFVVGVYILSKVL